MKKLLLLAVAAIMGIGMVSAKSVDVNTAKALGHKFVQANFEQGSASDLQLVYTFSNQRGELSLYVFDVDDNGFVIVSADEKMYQILGYSDNGAFSAEEASDGLLFLLDE